LTIPFPQITILQKNTIPFKTSSRQGAKKRLPFASFIAFAALCENKFDV